MPLPAGPITNCAYFMVAKIQLCFQKKEEEKEVDGKLRKRKESHAVFAVIAFTPLKNNCKHKNKTRKKENLLGMITGARSVQMYRSEMSQELVVIESPRHENRRKKGPDVQE